MTDKIQTPTPRTDSEEQWATWNGDGFRAVHSDFARQLERELIAARGELEKYKMAFRDLHNRSGKSIIKGLNIDFIAVTVVCHLETKLVRGLYVDTNWKNHASVAQAALSALSESDVSRARSQAQAEFIEAYAAVCALTEFDYTDHATNNLNEAWNKLQQLRGVKGEN